MSIAIATTVKRGGNQDDQRLFMFQYNHFGLQKSFFIKAKNAHSALREVDCMRLAVFKGTLELTTEEQL